MFTGIVEAVGTVTDVTPAGPGSRVRIASPLAATLVPGDSVAVNGVCLTVTTRTDKEWQSDIGPETARVTTLGELAPGQLVNLERPLRVDDRLGGHFVLGHVDGVGVLEHVRAEADAYWLTVAFPPALARLFIHKGSVAVDGVSLTVATLGAGQFDVMIIPYTWQHTTFRTRTPGDRLNLECDMIGKYIVRALELSDLRSPS